MRKEPNQLRQLIRIKGITITKLAKELDYSREGLYTYVLKNPLKTISMETFDKLAELLSVSPALLRAVMEGKLTQSEFNKEFTPAGESDRVLNNQ